MAQIGETELDLRALSLALWRRAWLLLVLAIAAAGATFFGLGFVDPLYTADTSILIEERESPLTRPREPAADSASDFDESAIQSQVEVLRSREIAEAVIDDLALTTRPEFDPARKPSVVGSLLVALGLDDAPTDSSIRQRVMESYFERLSVYPIQRSRVIGVEFSAPNPVLAAEVANAVADAFVRLQQDAKRQSAVAATAWLQQEIERLRGRVAEAEQTVADYRSNKGLFDVGRGGSADSSGLSTQQLGDINAELARARAARAEAEARANLVQQILDEGGSLDTSQEVLASPLIQRLRERQAALQAQIAELSTTLLPSHPRIRALEEQVANLDAQIRGEARKVLVSLNTAARVAAAREESLLRSLNDAKADVSRSNEEGIELRALEREAAAQRELLESFLSRYREAAARTDANYLPADARIISQAVPPRDPSFPKKTMMAIAAALAALLIGIAVVLLREFVSGRAFRLIGGGLGGDGGVPVVVRAPQPEETAETRREALRERAAAAVNPAPAASSEDAVAETAAEAAAETVAADMPEEGGDAGATEAGRDEEAAEPDEPELPTAADAGPPDIAASAVAEPPARQDDAERPARTADRDSPELADIIGGDDIHVALFAGAEGGEGTGTLAFRAAREAAKRRERCIVVDLGRRPAEALRHDGPGLQQLLAGNAAFGEVIQRDEAARVHLIPYGSNGGEPPMQRMQLVVGALTQSYDKVIVVADRLEDWPDEHLHPDVVAILCGPQTTERVRAETYDAALARGAKSAVIVRYSSELEVGAPQTSAAA